MNDCLQNIVSISDPCANIKLNSLSGLDLMDAPEITIGNLAEMATETYRSGLELAKRKLQMATLLISNDFIAALQSNNYVTNLNQTVYPTSSLSTGTNMGNYAGERGLVIHRTSKIRGKMRKLKLVDVSVFPQTSIDSVFLSVYDGSNKTSLETVSRYNVQLIAGQVNTFNLSYEVKGDYARVVIDNTDVQLCSAPVICGEGCHGTLPNDCGYARGWDGTREVRKGDAFGINVNFQCYCDYDQLLCDMSKTYIGELIFIKARILLLEEHLRSNRLTNWIIYNREETADNKKELEAAYISRWNTFIDSLPGILKSYRDECIDCRGIRWVVNG